MPSSNINHLSSIYHEMVNNEAIEAAIKDLKSQKKPNYAATAKSFNVNQNTFVQHFKG